MVCLQTRNRNNTNRHEQESQEKRKKNLIKGIRNPHARSPTILIAWFQSAKRSLLLLLLLFSECGIGSDRISARRVFPYEFQRKINNFAPSSLSCSIGLSRFVQSPPQCTITFKACIEHTKVDNSLRGCFFPLLLLAARDRELNSMTVQLKACRRCNHMCFYYVQHFLNLFFFSFFSRSFPIH